jgi:hypothetical protein
MSSRMVPLRALAHARAGDKNNTSNIAVFAYDPAHYPVLEAQLTPEAVAAHMAGLVRGGVRRYAVPQLQALNFVIDSALEGGVNGSLNLDGHGKSWSSFLLGIEIALPEDAPPPPKG